MKKVAIVGVEGSGKTVMLAGLGELYTHPDEDGFFLGPKNFKTASYVSEKIARMREGVWPAATAEDAMQGLDWTLRWRLNDGQKPIDVCEVSFLDFPGEVYRKAFGVDKPEDGVVDPNIVESLKTYIREADDLIVLINLRDVIAKGLGEPRVQEAMWITNEILSFALKSDEGRLPVHAAIVLSQADSYADTIKACDGPKGVLAKYLPHVANNYGWLDVFAVSAVDKVRLDDDGNLVPAPDFQPAGLKPIMHWILTAYTNELGKNENHGCGCLMVKLLTCSMLAIVATLYFKDDWRTSIECRILEMLDSCRIFICRHDAKALYKTGRDMEGKSASAVRLISASAAGGDADAQCQMGWMYANGIGVEKDEALAVSWYRKAVTNGHVQALNNLGTMYERGYGVGKDLEEAVRLYKKAEAQGNKSASLNLQRLDR